jgi:hypothetical protein
VNATLPFILPFKMSGGLSLSLPFTAHDKFQTLQMTYVFKQIPFALGVTFWLLKVDF